MPACGSRLAAHCLKCRDVHFLHAASSRTIPYQRTDAAARAAPWCRVPTSRRPPLTPSPSCQPARARRGGFVHALLVCFHRPARPGHFLADPFGEDAVDLEVNKFAASARNHVISFLNDTLKHQAARCRAEGTACCPTGPDAAGPQAAPSAQARAETPTSARICGDGLDSTMHTIAGVWAQLHNDRRTLTTSKPPDAERWWRRDTSSTLSRANGWLNVEVVGADMCRFYLPNLYTCVVS